MNAVASLLSEQDVLLALDVATRKEMFGCVGRLFEQRHGLSTSAVVESLLARERLGSTALGGGVAIPHARMKNLRRPVAAYVRLASPIAFDAPDGQPVSEMLVMMVPERATEHHLKILAEFVQMFGDGAFRKELQHCSTSSDVLAALYAWRGAQ
ncbi:MAG TPA: PTS sugar transporter subunit IIA [Burkholderiales bacterium]|nr:PTS sugar transporter subunit IIA [Burkholderiales bacterium]